MASDTIGQTIPVLEEETVVDKAEVVTKRLRVSTSIEQQPVIVEETLERGELHVERIAVSSVIGPISDQTNNRRR